MSRASPSTPPPLADLIDALRPRAAARDGTLRIAAAGHRSLGAAAGAVRETLAGLLRDLSAVAPPQRTTLVSSMAEGADRLAGQAALDAGMNLALMLPFGLRAYEKTFDLGDAAKAREEFRRLVAAARQPGGGGVTVLAPVRGDIDAAYRNCALRMVADCDLLIVVLRADQTGSHTAAAVREAQRLRIPAVQIDPDHPMTWRPALG